MDLLNISFSVSLLIAAIVIIRHFTINKFTKKTFAILWSIALIRLLVPISLPSPFSVFSLADKARPLVLQNLDPRLDKLYYAANDTYYYAAFNGPYNVPEQEQTPSLELPKTASNTGEAYKSAFPNEETSEDGHETKPKNSGFILAVIWLAGVALCAVYFTASHLRALFWYKTALPVENDFVNQWIDLTPLKRSIKVKQSDMILSPLTYGVFTPVILLPKLMESDSSVRLKYVLTHEYIHIKSLDVIKKWLFTAALCLHWFNPLVWLMYVLANRDIELYCDEKTVRFLGEDEKGSYAMTLIELMETNNGLPQLVSHFSKSSIEERIRAVMKFKKATFLNLLVAYVLITGITAVFATSAVNASALAAQVYLDPVAVQNAMKIQAGNIDGVDTLTHTIYCLDWDGALDLFNTTYETEREQMNEKYFNKLARVHKNEDWTGFSLNGANLCVIEYLYNDNTKITQNNNYSRPLSRWIKSFRKPDEEYLKVKNDLTLEIIQKINDGELKPYAPNRYRITKGLPKEYNLEQISIFFIPSAGKNDSGNSDIPLFVELVNTERAYKYDGGAKK